jgi:hypothetical protein
MRFTMPRSMSSSRGSSRPHVARTTERAVGTEFAKGKKAGGCHLGVYNKSKAIDYLTENGQKQGCSWWWLRTQPGSPNRAAFIGMQGSVRSCCLVNRDLYGVCLALKLIK